MTTEKKPAPTAAEIDDLCLAFDQAKIAVDKAEQKFSTAKVALMAAVEGSLYIADATVASTVEVIEASVAELQSELSRLQKPKVFAELFDRKVKHSLRKNAAGTLKLAIGGFALEVQSRLLSLYSSCLNVNVKAPALSVDLAAALRQKETEAQQKAERKAAKLAKKAGIE
jgi:hypothetical protein